MNVIPFKGYRYDASVVGNPGDCVAPPYDVIDADQQDDLYARNENNVVRLIKAKPESNDNDTNNVYTRAAESLKAFISSGALVEEDKDSIYVYSQDFKLGDQTITRNGFIALGQLQAYGDKIKPHEQTLAGPKADRLNLTRAIKTQVGQIFMLYSDAEKTIDAILAKACQGQPLTSHTDEDQVVHNLYVINDEQDIATITKVMGDKDVFIADGHHRYETALNYKAESGNPKADYQLMTFVNTHNEGLVVLPTHRLVHSVKNFNPEELVESLKGQFDVAQLTFDDMLDKKEKQQAMTDALIAEFEIGQRAFGMYFNNGSFYVATLRDISNMEVAAPNQSQAWRELDVSILHKLILEQHLGIDEAALTAQSNVKYIKDFGDATARAMDRVDSGEAQGLFFMNPTRIEDVEAVAMGGEKMPQKSTFFFPKIFSGLVLNCLEEKEALLNA